MGKLSAGLAKYLANKKAGSAKDQMMEGAGIKPKGKMKATSPKGKMCPTCGKMM